jgi:hypothetical protein
MNSIDTLATFFGWCTVINIGFVLFVLLVFAVFHEGFGRLTARIFGVTEAEAKATLFRIFMQYRVLIVVLNLVPYIALKIMSEA